MDDVYRDYRIAISFDDGWSARITHVRGRLLPLSARATADEGAGICLRRARTEIDRYTSFLSRSSAGNDDGERA